MEERVLEDDFAVIDHCLMIRMPKEIDHNSAYLVRESADRYLVTQEVEHIVFDFEQTVFMDSSGIGVVMGRYKKISCFGGRVFAIHTNARVRKILEMSGLHKIVEIIS